MYGQPTSWEENIAGVMFPGQIQKAAWSLCNRFIAVAWGMPMSTLEILDSVTLGQLTVLEFPLGKPPFLHWLDFSPDTCLLTCFCGKPGKLISWDLQTGVLVSAISLEQQTYPLYQSSVTYSASGTMLGVLHYSDYDSAIYTYNVFSGIHLCSHSFNGSALNIWTHGECLQFAMVGTGSITIWEVNFTSTHAPKEVGSLPLPNHQDFQGLEFKFHPIPSRLTTSSNGKISVWDAQDLKPLLNFNGLGYISFSLDGHFCACQTNGPELFLWKESPTGYILHRKLGSNTQYSQPLISPDGESIITLKDSSILLWRTTDSTTSLSAISTQTSPRVEKTFILGFSPDEALAAVI